MTTNSDLKQRAESILRLIEQRDELSADIKAAFDAAKSVGFNPSAMRKAVRIAAMSSEKREKHEAEAEEVQLYLFAIEGREIREAAE